MSGATFAHAMPFGATVEAGGVRFRLWAPGQTEVGVMLEGAGEAQPMAPQEGGYFELFSETAGPGTAYRYQLADGMRVPDPISRHQPADVHGPSLVVDPRAHVWRHPEWRGRPWHETVLYELHLGTFSDPGTFDGLRRRLDHLVELGVTAVELMPLADFPGRRNWGYDGVLPFAPDASHGTPDDLKRLIDELHGRGLMAFLDVVYNHFGPDGNYLHVYAPQYFDPDKHTPWGAAIDYAEPHVRAVAVHNVLYWLEEYRFDGLRFDAVDQIVDDAEPHILTEIAERVRRTIPPDRHVHLVLENDANEASRLTRRPDGAPVHYTAQWNDDIHHVYHHLLTGESGGYYADYAERPLDQLARALGTGFVYQGEPSAYRGDTRRGEPSDQLPATAFVSFLQNHDQIGNRAFGERIASLSAEAPRRCLTALWLLAPQVPLLFMGQEWGATQPFCYFTDFQDELAAAVREGRRREFGKFPEFADEAARARIPDPNAISTFERSKLDWSALDEAPHRAALDFVRELLAIRRDRIVPRLAGCPAGDGAVAETWDRAGLGVVWPLADGGRLQLLANLAGQPSTARMAPVGRALFEWPAGARAQALGGTLPPWSVVASLAPPAGDGDR